jgi:hypothetical protein
MLALSVAVVGLPLQVSAGNERNDGLEQVTYSDDNRYTSAVLLQAIQTTLDKAEVTAADDDADGI